jgi:hypothetical protein
MTENFDHFLIINNTYKLNLMKKQQFLLLAIIMLMICFGCSNDDDLPKDLASEAVGLYEGKWNVQNNAYGTCEVVRINDTSAKLNLKIAGIQLPVPDVKLSDGGNGKINLNYSDSEGSISGSFQNSAIIVKLPDGTTSYTFTGNKK